jgi:hypothetical protein
MELKASSLCLLMYSPFLPSLTYGSQPKVLITREGFHYVFRVNRLSRRRQGNVGKFAGESLRKLVRS